MRTQIAVSAMSRAAVPALVLFLVVGPPAAYAVRIDTLTVPKDDTSGLEEVWDHPIGSKPKEEKPIRVPEPASIVTLGLGLLGLGLKLRKRK